jgi:hypothetical protein
MPATLLGGVVQRIQIPDEIAEWIAQSLQHSQTDAEHSRRVAVHELEQRKRAVQRKLDRV